MTTTIGQQIKKLLKEKGISVAAFSKMLDRKHVSVYKMLKKEHIHSSMLAKISEVLQHDMFQYLTEKPASEKQLQEQIAALQKENEQLKTENTGYLKEIVRLQKK